MANVLYFPNLRADGDRPTATGTKVTDASTVDHACLDVFARNDSSNPLYVSAPVSTANLLDQDIHDASAVNVNAVGGAFKAFGSGITIPAGTKYVQISSTMGEPLTISFADALGNAASSAKQVYLVPGGAPGKLEFIPGTSNLAFIKSLSANSITDGYVVLNFIG